MNSPSMGLKPWEPGNLTPLHKNILTLIAAGMRAREISKMEGMPSESRISVIKNSPAGQAFLRQQSAEIVKRLRSDVNELISAHAEEAVNTVVQLMRASDSDQVRLSASKDLLDRGGHKPTERQEVVHYEVDAEDVDRLVAAMREARADYEEPEFYDESHKLFDDPNEIEIL